MGNRVRKPGESRKLYITPKTIDDDMVRDGLQGISLLNETQPYFIVGGVATQSYLPSSCRRETSDIDLCLVKPLNYNAFKNMMAPVAEYLQDKGYDLETRKGSRSFSLNFNDDSGETLAIEAPKRNGNNIEKNRGLLQREMDNSRSKIVEERDSTYRVIAPEDIALPKLVRSVNALERSPGALGGILPSELGSLTDEYIEKRLVKIKNLRDEAMHSPGDHKIGEILRFASDIYDIRILAEVTGFNEIYWNEGLNDWNDLQNKKPLFERLMSVTVPEFTHAR